MTSRPGHIVLVRFPFTDLSQSKKRPAIVVSPEGYEQRFGDVVFVPITSKASADSDDLQITEWDSSGLLKPSWVKPLIATISSAYIVQRIGCVAPTDLARVRHAMGLLIDDVLIGVAA